MSAKNSPLSLLTIVATIRALRAVSNRKRRVAAALDRRQYQYCIAAGRRSKSQAGSRNS
jgi:hypothetical protein